MYVNVWSPEAGLPIMLKIETAGTPTQSCETLTPTPVVAGWNTLEFDFSNERPGTAALNTSFVFDLASIFFNFDVSGATAGEKTFYFDNVSFANPLSTEQFEISTFKAFPNPTQDSWNIKTTQNINNIEVYDMLGKRVMVLKPEVQEISVNASELNSGLYFAKITTPSGTSSIKLIKK